MKQMSLVALLCLGTGSWAELQNVTMNGFYVMMKTEDRSSTVFQKLYPEDQAHPVLALSSMHYLAHGADLHEVAIPKLPQVTHYASNQHIMIAFYTGHPGRPSGTKGTASLLVHVDGKRVLVLDDIEIDWRLRFIDVTDWAGRTVRVRFLFRDRGEEPDTEQFDGVIAHPRIVIWHGPYYEGIGGIGSYGGRHGHRPVSKTEGLYRGAQIEPSKMSSPPLKIEWFDFVQPSTLKFATDSKNIEYRLGQGLQPIATRLGPNEKLRIQLLNGEVEHGAVDVIPDFTIGDEEILATIK